MRIFFLVLLTVLGGCDSLLSVGPEGTLIVAVGDEDTGRGIPGVTATVQLQNSTAGQVVMTRVTTVGGEAVFELEEVGPMRASIELPTGYTANENPLFVDLAVSPGETVSAVFLIKRE